MAFWGWCVDCNDLRLPPENHDKVGTTQVSRYDTHMICTLSPSVRQRQDHIPCGCDEILPWVRPDGARDSAWVVECPSGQTQCQIQGSVWAVNVEDKTHIGERMSARQKRLLKIVENGWKWTSLVSLEAVVLLFHKWQNSLTQLFAFLHLSLWLSFLSFVDNYDK